MNTKDSLQDCLERLERGEKMEQVLAHYPEQRENLVHLLTLATSLQRAAPKITESSKARVRYELYGAMRAHQARTTTPAWRVWLLRAVLSLTAVLMLGGGTLVAAAESAPGGTLFPARALINETRARITNDPRAGISLHLESARDRVTDVQLLKQRNNLNEGSIFLMVGETENLMVALDNNPKKADRSTLERALQLVRDERALLRALTQTTLERPRQNAETLYQLSETWLPLVNRLLDQTR